MTLVDNSLSQSTFVSSTPVIVCICLASVSAGKVTTHELSLLPSRLERGVECFATVIGFSAGYRWAISSMISSAS